MSKMLKSAITNAREFYIDKLIATGYFLDHGLLSSYTLSELKKEYTTLIEQRSDKDGNE
ncbi:Fur-regulated basic protein FbpA [Sutcliffiella horikoshii]|uniref:Fur-regulated basic protein FbpA n=1 Tax=Sutcliffiella horikoshii TaxID=79883 RepID=UPI001F387EC3|nr:Fur-regulated basic protein FbpA [Sutcliffiella horikoshii]MCG1021064.1 Fur-regulated basic protein FbpA [Sutcliffiella horikoshii]